MLISDKNIQSFSFSGGWVVSLKVLVLKQIKLLFIKTKNVQLRIQQILVYRGAEGPRSPDHQPPPPCCLEQTFTYLYTWEHHRDTSPPEDVSQCGVSGCPQMSQGVSGCVRCLRCLQVFLRWKLFSLNIFSCSWNSTECWSWSSETIWSWSWSWSKPRAVFGPGSDFVYLHVSEKYLILGCFYLVSWFKCILRASFCHPACWWNTDHMFPAGPGRQQWWWWRPRGPQHHLYKAFSSFSSTWAVWRKMLAAFGLFLPLFLSAPLESQERGPQGH